MLVRFANLAVSHAFAALRLPPMSDRKKDVEILVLRHQITVLERQLGGDKVTFSPEDRAFLAALLVPLPREFLRRLVCLSVQTRCCGGVVTSWGGATREAAGRSAPGVRRRSVRSGS
ncbi:hypothetical protein [Streptacidiphilus melanogenes]|uniref:hypothetical protein n=1 Tax=Streptacidiphilus melanogenes TaxID=411235 RepID=UPI0034E2246C